MELTGFPFWTIEYAGSDEPKITGHLSEAKEFVANHEVTSITFYVNVWFTTPGKGGLEKQYCKTQISNEEMETLADDWLTQKMAEARMRAQDYLETGK